MSLDDDQQELAEFLISAASAQAERLAGRPLAARDVSVKLDACGGREILLPSYPVNSTSRVCVDIERLFPEEKDLKADQYDIKNDAGIIRLLGWHFAVAYGAVLFEGNIGYSPVPEDLQQAAIEAVSANIRRFAGIGGTVGIKQMSANGAITTQYEIDLPLTSRSIFLSYRGARA